MFKSAFYLAVIIGLIFQADAQFRRNDDDLPLCLSGQDCEISMPFDQNHMEYRSERQ